MKQEHGNGRRPDHNQTRLHAQMDKGDRQKGEILASTPFHVLYIKQCTWAMLYRHQIWKKFANHLLSNTQKFMMESKQVGVIDCWLLNFSYISYITTFNGTFSRLSSVIPVMDEPLASVQFFGTHLSTGVKWTLMKSAWQFIGW